VIGDRAIDQAFSDLKAVCGGIREDYFEVRLERIFVELFDEAYGYVRQYY